jgi:hypothetical protein
VHSGEVSLIKIRVLFDSIEKCLFSYLVSTDRVSYCNSVLDNTQACYDIDDDEHIYVQVYNNGCLCAHM